MKQQTDNGSQARGMTTLQQNWLDSPGTTLSVWRPSLPAQWVQALQLTIIGHRLTGKPQCMEKGLGVPLHPCKLQHSMQQHVVRRHNRRARTSFSASPCHLEVREEAEMAKKVARASAASALASSVLPLPGGPYSSRPRAGARSPCDCPRP